MLKIIANGIELELVEGAGISLNFINDDIDNATVRRSNFSKQIRLPGTPETNEFFAFNFDVSVSNFSFNPKKKIPCVLTDGSDILIEGGMQLLRVYDNIKYGIEYEVQIVGTYKKISNLFGELSTRDLDFSEFNHIRNKETIKNSHTYLIQNNGDWKQNVGPGEGYVYPYAIYGGSTNIFQNQYIYDCFPGTYLNTIFRKAFDKIGYTLKSDFLDSDFMKMQFLPYVGEGIKVDEQTYENQKAIIGIVDEFQAINSTTIERGDSFNNGYIWPMFNETDLIDDKQFQDPSNQWSAAAGFECAKTGNYDIALDGKLFAKYFKQGGGNVQWTGTGTMRYRYNIIIQRVGGPNQILFQSGPQDFAPSDGTTHVSPWTDLANPLLVVYNGNNIFLAEGDKIKVEFNIFYPTTDTNWAGGANTVELQMVLKQSFDGAASFISFLPSSNLSFGNEDISLNQTISNIKLNDLVMDIVKSYNLVMKIEDNNTILLETEKDYYKSKQEIKNLDGLFENEGDLTIIPTSEIDFKKFILTYKEDSDYYNELYKDNYGEVFGTSNIYNLDNDFSDKVETFERIFAATPVSNKYVSNRLAPQFIQIDEENIIKPQKVKDRILFYGGLKPMNTAIYLQDNAADDSPLTLTEYAYAGMWESPTSPRFSLEFEPSHTQYFPTSIVAANGLYNMFFSEKFNNLISNDAKIVEGYFRLTNKWISEFDDRDIMEFHGQYWRIIEISEFNPVGDDSLTKIRMYKLLDFSPNVKDFYQRPINSESCPFDIQSVIGRDGRIIFESASGQIITEDCCKSFGGVMTGGVCYLPRRVSTQTDSAFSDLTPSKPNVDNNTIDSPQVIVRGEQNVVAEGVENSIILGERNSVGSNAKNVFVLGDDFDGEFIDRDDCIFGNNIKLKDTGSIEIGDLIITSASTIGGGGNFLPLSGGTMSGDITMSMSTKVKASGDGFIEFLSDDIFISSTSSFIQVAAGPDEIKISTGDLIVLGDLYNENKDVVVTTGDTETTLKTLQLTANDTNYQIETNVMVVKDNGIDGGSIKLLGTFNRLAGVVVQIGQTTVTSNLTKPVEAFYDIDGIDVRVRVIGESGQTYKWGAQQIINKLTF